MNLARIIILFSNIIWCRKREHHDPYNTGTPVQHIGLLPLNSSRSGPTAHHAHA